MLLILIKAIVIVVAAFSITKSYLDYRKQQESRTMFGFWMIVWVGAATVVVYPLLIDRIIQYFKDQTITVGTVISFAFIFMLFIVYRIYAKAVRIEYQQAELIRKLGLKKALKKS